MPSARMRFIPTWAEATIAPLAKAPSNNIAGMYNTAAGSFALANSTGDYNIALGTTAGFNQTFGSYNIYIGDTGDDWPGWEETYRRLLTSIDAKSQLHLLGRVLTRGEVLRILQTWLRLQDAWRRRPRSRPSRSTRRCSSSGRRARARRSCSSCSRSTRAARAARVGGAASAAGRRRDADASTAPAAAARGVRAGVLGRHPSRVHDDARARERPAVRVRALLAYDFAVRTGRCSTTRRASWAGSSSTSRRSGARVPPAPPDAADVPARASGRRSRGAGC